MAIKFVSVKCPECGAMLDVEEGRQQLFCSYCGAKVMIQNDNEYIYRHIDEASIKQTEADAMLRMKELELEAKEEERSRKGRRIAYTIALVFVVIGFISWSSLGYVSILSILIGGYIAEFTLIDNMGKKKKRQIISSSEVQISEIMADYNKKNHTALLALFRAAGFTNVNEVPLSDLNIFTAQKNGQVESITINGDSDFDEGDVFPKSAIVTITYHSFS